MFGHQGITAAVCTLAAVQLAACSGGAGAGGGNAGPTAPQTPAAACQAAVTVDLQPGQRLSLSAAQAACMSLPARGGAHYVLAGFDARAVDAARGAPEPLLSSEPLYRIGDGSPAAPVAVPSTNRLAALSAADHEVRRSGAVDAADPFARQAPWQAGERFPVKRRDTGATATARVEAVIGRFVLAVVDQDATGHAPRFVSDTRAALQLLQREGAAVLEGAFGGVRPSTSRGSGQLLVLLAAWNPDQGAGLATTHAAPDGSGVSSYVWLNLEVRPGVREGFDRLDHPAYRLKVVAHELAHAWQMAYAYESQPAGARSVAFGPMWAMEGTADLVAMDLVRRSLGVGLTANWDWQARLRAGGDEAIYALEPYTTRGRLAGGYFDAASFLRDVQVRLVRAGLPADEALAQVSRGAVEGWFGVDAAGVRRRGLADRVRAVLGQAWEPADAVLLWTLAQAADDQTSAPDLNNPVYARAAHADDPYSWQAAVDEVEAGRSVAYELRRVPGSSFFVRIRDGGRGGTFSATSTFAGTHWMIARVR